MCLEVQIGNSTFSNPILVASGTFGYGFEIHELVDVNRLGGIITKSVTLHPREGNPPPRICETASGMLNSIGLANVGVEYFLEKIMPEYSNLEPQLIINIAGRTQEEYSETLEKIESHGGCHVGYEINISCPNVREGGMEFGISARMTEKLTRELRQLTNRLLIMKLSPNVTLIEDIARAAEQGGADAVSAINTLVGMEIDIRTRRPKLFTTYGGLSGPAIKPVALARVHKIHQAITIPIIGMGGIASCEDVVAFMLAGASLVQIGTLNFREPAIAVRLVEELTHYVLDEYDGKLRDLVGAVELYDQ